MHPKIRSVALAVSPKLANVFKKHRARRNTFSQFGEDIVLWNLLDQKPRGFYVDCGAFDPYIYSNTAIFYAAGWSGINIEPQKTRWEMFQSMRKRDINLCEVVSNLTEEVDFVECDVPTLSGINSEVQLSNQGRIVRRQPISLASIIETHAPETEIDFLSVDCEGHDIAVLTSNDWSRMRPRYLVVEDHARANYSQIDEFMAKINYRFVIRLGPSKIYMRA